MAADIGSLALKLSADPSGTIRGLDRMVSSVRGTAQKIDSIKPPGGQIVGQLDKLHGLTQRIAQSGAIKEISQGLGSLARGNITGSLTQLSGGFRTMTATMGPAARAAGVVVSTVADMAAGLSSLVSHQTAVIDSTAKMADRIGTSVESLQSLQHAADLAGVDGGTLNTVINRFTQTLGDLSLGTGEAVRSFEALGLSANDLSGLEIDQALTLVSARLAGITNAATRAAVSTDLFGRGGMRVLNLVMGDAERSIAGARRELERYNALVTRDEAAQVEAIVDSQARLNRAFEGMGNRLSVVVAPAAIGFNELLADIVATVSRFLEPAMRGLIDAVVDVGRAFGEVIDIDFDDASDAARAFGEIVGSVFRTIGRVIASVIQVVGQLVKAIESALDLVGRGSREAAASLASTFQSATGAFGELSGAQTRTLVEAAIDATRESGTTRRINQIAGEAQRALQQAAVIRPRTEAAPLPANRLAEQLRAAVAAPNADVPADIRAEPQFFGLGAGLVPNTVFAVEASTRRAADNAEQMAAAMAAARAAAEYGGLPDIENVHLGRSAGLTREGAVGSSPLSPDSRSGALRGTPQFFGLGAGFIPNTVFAVEASTRRAADNTEQMAAAMAAARAAADYGGLPDIENVHLGRSGGLRREAAVGSSTIAPGSRSFAPRGTPQFFGLGAGFIPGPTDLVQQSLADRHSRVMSTMADPGLLRGAFDLEMVGIGAEYRGAINQFFQEEPVQIRNVEIDRDRIQQIADSLVAVFDLAFVDGATSAAETLRGEPQLFSLPLAFVLADTPDVPELPSVATSTTDIPRLPIVDAFLTAQTTARETVDSITHGLSKLDAATQASRLGERFQAELAELNQLRQMRTLGIEVDDSQFRATAATVLRLADEIDSRLAPFTRFGPLRNIRESLASVTSGISGAGITANETAAAAVTEQTRLRGLLNQQVDRLQDQVRLHGLAGTELERQKLIIEGIADTELARFDRLASEVNRLREMDELLDAGARLEEEFQSPLNRVQERMAELNNLFFEGVISAHTFAAATEQAIEQAAGSLAELSRPQAPRGLEQGSVEALQSIIQFQQSGMQEGEGDRLERLMEQIRRQDSDRNRRLEQIVRLLEQGGLQVAELN